MTAQPPQENGLKVVLATDAAQAGGVWRHLVDLARGLEALGHGVTIAVPSHADALLAEGSMLGLDVQALDGVVSGDVWHLHLANTFWSEATARLRGARRGFTAVVLTEHLPRSVASDPTALPGNRPRPGGRIHKTWTKRRHFDACDRVIFVSEGSRRFAERRYGFSGPHAVVVPNGIAVQEAGAPIAAIPEATRVVAIGSVIVQKGFDLLIDAAELAAEPWVVEVLGEGEHRARLSAEAASRNVPVRFLGRSASVAEALDQSVALVVPSRWEAWPYVAMEAMDRGRAVVATTVDGLPEIVEDGHTGLLVPPEDPAELAKALDRLAHDHLLAASMGAAGRARVASFSLERMVDGVTAAYRSALAEERDQARRWST